MALLDLSRSHTWTVLDLGATFLTHYIGQRRKEARMKLFVDQGSSTPLYQQVRDSLRALIASGKLAPGDELPASRTLAETLGVNRGTVTTAYDELVAQGLLERHVGRGTFVAAAAEVESLRERSSAPEPT